MQIAPRIADRKCQITAHSLVARYDTGMSTLLVLTAIPGGCLTEDVSFEFLPFLCYKVERKKKTERASL